jgi:hypothetical protein
MRKVIGISMVVLFLLTVITGMAELGSLAGPNSLQDHGGPHIIISILFTVSTLTHIVLNRKPFVRYFMSTVKTDRRYENSSDQG